MSSHTAARYLDDLINGWTGDSVFGEMREEEKEEDGVRQGREGGRLDRDSLMTGRGDLHY